MKLNQGSNIPVSAQGAEVLQSCTFLLPGSWVKCGQLYPDKEDLGSNTDSAPY